MQAFAQATQQLTDGQHERAASLFAAALACEELTDVKTRGSALAQLSLSLLKASRCSATRRAW